MLLAVTTFFQLILSVIQVKKTAQLLKIMSWQTAGQRMMTRTDRDFRVVHVVLAAPSYLFSASEEDSVPHPNVAYCQWHLH